MAEYIDYIGCGPFRATPTKNSGRPPLGLGAYPGSDRQFLGMLGMHGSYQANLAMHHQATQVRAGEVPNYRIDPKQLPERDRAAFRRNLAALRDAAAPAPLRIATKSIRVRALIEEALRHDGVSGLFAYSVAEARWLVSHGLRDVLVAYPSTDAVAMRAIADDEDARAHLQYLLVVHRSRLEREQPSDVDEEEM